MPTASPRTNQGNSSRKTYCHLRDIDHALLAGDLTSAQRSFARLLVDSPRLADIAHSRALPGESLHRQHFRQLFQALGNQDLRAARESFDHWQAASETRSVHPFDPIGVGSRR